MKLNFRRFVCLALLALAATPSSGAAPAAAPPYRVIVNSKNPVQSLSRDKVAAYFLKKTSTWDDGAAVQPVDQSDDTAVRKVFSTEVVKKSVSAVKAYWQQRIFSGRDLPPPEKGSDDEVVAYVKSNDRAIGYVSASAEVAGVKVISVSE